MRELLPEDPPTDGEAWDKIFKDVEGVIMPGVNILSFVEIKIRDSQVIPYYKQVEQLNKYPIHGGNGH